MRPLLAPTDLGRFQSTLEPNAAPWPVAEEVLWDQVGFPSSLDSLMPRFREALSTPTDDEIRIDGDLARWVREQRQQLNQGSNTLSPEADPMSANSEYPFEIQPEELLRLLIEYLMSQSGGQSQQGRNLGTLRPMSSGGSPGGRVQPASYHNPSGSGGSSGAHNSGDKPAELAAYGNGRIPEGALEPIGVGNHRLYGPAAEAFKQMRADAAAEGVNIGVTDSYRSYEEQVDLANRKGLYSQGGLAAKPGTSDHGWGLALDLKLDDKALAWMRQNAGRYGFEEDTPREPWHWAFKEGSTAVA